MKNLPNILSSIRIFLVPIFIAVYFMDRTPGNMKLYAAIVYAAASATDFLDGFIARKYNLISKLGKILDPLGDKLMTLAVLTCITIDQVIPVWAVLVAIVKEALMLIGGMILRKKDGGEIPASNIIGKASTVVFFVVCVTLMLFRIPDNIAIIMISSAIALMLIALFSYTLTFLHVVKRTNGLGKNI